MKTIFKSNSKMQHYFRSFFGVFITGVCLYFFVKQIDLIDITSSLESIDIRFSALGLISLAAGYFFRILRWSIMLSAAGSRTNFATAIAPFLGSIGLNNLLPLRLGDLVRAVVFPCAMGVSRSSSIATIILERLIDVTILLLCFTLGLIFVPSVISHNFKDSIIFLIIVVCVLLIASLFFSRFFCELFKKFTQNSKNINVIKFNSLLSNFFNSIYLLSDPAFLFKLVSISIVLWFFEGGLYYFTFLSLGIDSSSIFVLIIMSIATLSTLMPSSPGYIGTYHMAILGGFTAFGESTNMASVFAVVVHLALWFPTTMAGVYALIVKPELFRFDKYKFL